MSLGILWATYKNIPKKWSTGLEMAQWLEASTTLSEDRGSVSQHLCQLVRIHP